MDKKLKVRIFYLTLVSICFFLSLFDFIFTITIINTGGFKELNPFFFPAFLLVPLFYAFKGDKWDIILVGLITLFYLFPVVSNLMGYNMYLDFYGGI